MLTSMHEITYINLLKEFRLECAKQRPESEANCLCLGNWITVNDRFRLGQKRPNILFLQKWEHSEQGTKGAG